MIVICNEMALLLLHLVVYKSIYIFVLLLYNFAKFMLGEFTIMRTMCALCANCAQTMRKLCADYCYVSCMCVTFCSIVVAVRNVKFLLMRF